MAYVLALDQGTSSSRAMVFDKYGAVIAMARRELAVSYPHPGWVEQDANEIWSSQRDAAEEALNRAGVGARAIAAIGLANQRETTVIWNRDSGQPIAPAIVWQDRRTAALCEQLNAQGMGERIRSKTGLRLDAYFSATKIAWILEHVTGARQRAERGELAFGTVDCWLTWKLTQGRVHATDVTNAARTLLLDINTFEWDAELLELFHIPRALLPDVRPCCSEYGSTRLGGGDIAIAGIAGDQPAALLGQQCRAAGQGKNTYGTGAFLLLHTGPKRVEAEGLLAGPVCSLPGETPAYGLEGSIFVAGAWVQWLRDNLRLFKRSEDIEALALQVPDSGGVTIVPALTGLGAPFWDATARGTILGLTRGTTAAHIARASLEAIALQTRDVIEATQAALSTPIRELRVDGGAARNNLLLQIQADILGVPILRSQTTETTAMGAAMLAAAGSGAADSTAFADWWKADKTFMPEMSAEERDRRYRRWRRAIERARHWESDTGA